MLSQLIQDPRIALLLILWTLPWKGYALWLAAKKDKRWWFIALLVINTVGILEIIYIFLISKLEEKSAQGGPAQVGKEEAK